MNFDRSLDVPAGIEMRLSPLVSRVLAPNPGPFTFRGTGVYIVGAGQQVAVIDPGPAICRSCRKFETRARGAADQSHSGHPHPSRSFACRRGLESLERRQDLWLAASAPSIGRSEEGMVDEAHDHDFVPDIAAADGMRIAGDGFALGMRRHARPYRQPHLLWALAGTGLVQRRSCDGLVDQRHRAARRRYGRLSRQPGKAGGAR